MFGKFQNAVVWGVKGKILCPAGCQNPVTRITKAKEILKNPRPAGSWRPLKCIFSGKEKRSPTAGRKSCSIRSMYGKTRQGQSAAVLEQDSTAVPNFAYRSFCPCGNLVGECLPQTLLMRLTPLEKFPQILFGLFQKQFRYTPRFSPISERTPRTERRSTTYETI